MPTPGKMILLSQLHSLEHTGFRAKLETAAAAHGLPAAYVFAVASRETNCHNILGDFQGGQFHGVGIMQIDIQHQIARDARDNGSWKTHPEPLLAFGAKLLHDNIAQAAHRFPNFTPTQHLKIAASGYNAGMGGAISGAVHGDSDLHTTGHDYGRDVMARMGIFEELISDQAHGHVA